MFSDKLIHKHPDYLIMGLAAFLVFFGLVMLASASANIGKLRFDDNYFYLKHQLWSGLLPGLIGFVLGFYLYYGWYEKLAPFIFLICVAALLLIFSPLGVRAGGADRWLNLGFITFQPSEFMKIAFVLYISAWLSGNRERNDHVWKGLVPFVLLLAALAGILLKQSSTSTFALLMMTACVVYFVGGGNTRHLVTIGAIGAIGLLIVSFFTPYRWQRIVTFINPNQNFETSSYHINQALTAISVGGSFGVGLGESTSKIGQLPEPIGDSIFAVAAEELGFTGIVLIIAAIAILALRILLLSRKIPHRFGQLVLIGFGTMLALQSFVNIGAISGLIPLTGMPLPFVSYGGTALVAYMTIIGIVTNISKYARK
jgi:cell division protein FtsW